MQANKNQSVKLLVTGIFIGILAVFLYFQGMFKFKNLSESKGEIFVENTPYKKLVFVILDGLRIDGVVNTKRKSLYHNNFKFLSNLDDAHKKTFLAVSGLPTGTVFRVKSILTGFPTNFLDFSQIISNKKVDIDNLIKKLPKSMTFFYGDSTWKDLFSEIGQNSKTYSPYDKLRPDWEEKALMSQFVSEIGKYPFTLAHFVYLDHYGHIYGTQHTKVQYIMQEYDKMLQSVYERLDEDTLLVVLSDHGVNNDGSHGGASIFEISSFCSFLSKKPFYFQKDDLKEEIRSEYLQCKYKSDLDWIQSLSEIHMCHQDDIMPTVCGLIGIPFPFYTTGNLIYEFFRDEIPEMKLLEQKQNVLRDSSYCFRNEIPTMKLLEQKQNILRDSSYPQEKKNGSYRLNYILSDEIIKKFMTKDLSKVLKSFFIFIISICIFVCILSQNIKKITNFRKTHFNTHESFVRVYAFLTIIMVCHSVHSFLHEDYIWILLFFISEISAEKFLQVVLFCLIGRFPQHEEDRFLKIPKISPQFSSLPETLLLLAILLIIFGWRKKSMRFFDQIVKISFSEHLLVVAARYFNPTFGTDLGLNLFYLDPSMKTLALCIYSPLTYIYTQLFLNTHSTQFSPVEAFALVNSTIFSIEMNHDLSSIKYDVLFIFSKKFLPELSLVIFMTYLFYPVHLVLRSMQTDAPGFTEFVLMSTFHMFLTAVVGLWFENNWLFHLFFGGRLVFVAGYFMFVSIWVIVRTIFMKAGIQTKN